MTALAHDRVPIARREWIVVAVLTVVAAALRAWHLSQAGIGQYDEGVYGFTGWGLIDPGQPFRFYPQQEKFSPPFYFSMVALSYLLRGVSDTSAILVNVVLGTATIPILWLIGRKWFGGSAAAAAATLLVFGPSHLTLSRSALTDVAFALNFIFALAALAWALETGGVRQAVLAGLATGLVWNTKYHGWFAGVIAIGTVLAIHWRDRRPEETQPRLRILAVAAGVAIACYLPWALYIRSQPESVEGWSRYFATLLRLNWPANLMQHVRQQNLLESSLSGASVPLAFLAALIAHPTALRMRVRRLAPWALVVAATAVLAGSFVTASLATLAAVPLLLRRGRITDWMLLVWLALWFVMAPLYQPYFRLLLPFSVAIYLGAGLWMSQRLGDLADDAPSTLGARLPSPIVVGATALLAYVAVPLVRREIADPWGRSDAFRNAAMELTRSIPPDGRVTVVGEPPVAYYLHLAGRPAFESPTPESIDSMQSTGYLVTGAYSKRAPQLREVLARRRPHLDSITTVHVEPSDLRLIDDGGAKGTRAYRRAPTDAYDLTLYRFK